jgi:hypothetical protein
VYTPCSGHARRHGEPADVIYKMKLHEWRRTTRSPSTSPSRPSSSSQAVARRVAEGSAGRGAEGRHGDHPFADGAYTEVAGL